MRHQSGERVTFNLDTGVATIEGSVISSATALDVDANGFRRCFIVFTAPQEQMGWQISHSGANSTFSAAEEVIYLWGAQMVDGELLRDYVKTEGSAIE
jgi:hypothetical protein